MDNNFLIKETNIIVIIIVVIIIITTITIIVVIIIIIIIIEISYIIYRYVVQEVIKEMA